MAEAVHQLLRSGNFLVVAECLRLSWHTAKAWSKALLHQSLPAPDWSPIHDLAMDIFALHKGHRDAMVMAAPIGRQILRVEDGRSRERARAFFEQLPAGVAELS